jgi:DNA polymerase-1
VPSGEEFRSLFVAEPGSVLVAADYQGQEMRILAELTGEPLLIDAFETGKDIHKLAASYMFGKDVEEITKPERTRAKTLQFGLVYGRGAVAFAQDMHITEEAAYKMIDKYFSAYPKVKAWMSRQRSRAEQDGYVRTIMGRKIPLNMDSETKSWKREAINYPIQGTGADMTKMAMAEINDVLPEYSGNASLVAAIHDELLVECPEEDAPTVAKVVVACMERAGSQVLEKVPVTAEVAYGPAWKK